MQNNSIVIAESKDNLQKFWELRDEYMVMDVFPFDELGSEITEEEKEWFFSSEYREHMNSLYEREIDRAFPIFFIEDDKIVGFCSYCTFLSEDGKCFIIDFCILPEYRDNGRGSSFFQLLKTTERTRGAKYFALNCSNHRNKHFWEMQGFEYIGLDEHSTPIMTMDCDDKDSYYEKPVILKGIDQMNFQEVRTLGSHI